MMHDLSDLNQRFEKAAPQDILGWAVETFGRDLAFVTSFQPSGLVMLHMLYDMGVQANVLTLDTGLLFTETNELIERWEQDFNLKVTRIRPPQTVAEQTLTHGAALWERDPDHCCALRKTAPLGDALIHYQAWITGLRRDQSAARQDTRIVSWDTKYKNFKLAPLATWTDEMVWTYIHAYELPYNALHDQHYYSIGCQPCTRAVASGEDTRAGRWSGRAKTECGIHLPQPLESGA
ncbi:MAG: phosphoadenylyl-sulfate reductase [bacterium]|nr:phosphoadenylyl-sulfate reductase [bacterium]